MAQFFSLLIQISLQIRLLSSRRLWSWTFSFLVFLLFLFIWWIRLISTRFTTFLFLRLLFRCLGSTTMAAPFMLRLINWGLLPRYRRQHLVMTSLLAIGHWGLNILLCARSHVTHFTATSCGGFRSIDRLRIVVAGMISGCLWWGAEGERRRRLHVAKWILW